MLECGDLDGRGVCGSGSDGRLRWPGRHIEPREHDGMLYRGMDRTQLDAAYNNSAAVPERDAIIADWTARSATVRREHAGHLDMPYGESPRERLDLFLASNPKAPTLAFIHGGYWQMNDKENSAFFAEGLLPLGINLAVVEYTLAPAARLDRIVAEVRRSVQWLAEHLGDYGADP